MKRMFGRSRSAAWPGPASASRRTPRRTGSARESIDMDWFSGPPLARPTLPPGPGWMLGQVAVELGAQLLLVGPGIGAVEEAVAGFLMKAIPAVLFMTGIDRVEQGPHSLGCLEVA